MKDKGVPYLPKSTNVTKNLSNVNVANLTGIVSHIIGGKVYYDSEWWQIRDAKQISIQITWSELSSTTAIFQVKTSLSEGKNHKCENTDETTQNSTQRTLKTVAGNEMIHLAPSNYEDIELNLDPKTLVSGNIDVVVLLKF